MGKKEVHGSRGLFFKSLTSPPPPPPPSFPTPQRGRSENKKLVYMLSQTLNFKLEALMSKMFY